jgi:hypothetical protein
MTKNSEFLKRAQDTLHAVMIVATDNARLEKSKYVF